MGQGRRLHPLHHPHTEGRFSPALRSRVVRLLAPALLLLLPNAALAQFTIQRVSSPIFYDDAGNSPSLTCMYAGYRITNTSGVTYPDVWAGIGSFAGGVVHLAPTDDGVLHLGMMPPGQSRMAYFYL